MQASRLLADAMSEHPSRQINGYIVSEDAATRMEEELFQVGGV